MLYPMNNRSAPPQKEDKGEGEEEKDLREGDKCSGAVPSLL